MTTPQEQRYTQTVQQAQDAMLAALRHAHRLDDDWGANANRRNGHWPDGGKLLLRGFIHQG